MCLAVGVGETRVGVGMYWGSDTVGTEGGGTSRERRAKWYFWESQERRPGSARQSGGGRFGLSSQQVAL